MTTSYIFSSHAFSGDESGGMFYKGRRRFRLACSSAHIVARIARLESARAPFPAEELPEQVAAVLLHAGLLHEYLESHGAWGRLRCRIGDSVDAMTARLSRGLSPQLREAAGCIGMQLRSLSTKTKKPASIVLLPRPLVRVLAPPMALLGGPVTMGAALILESAWLAANLPAHMGFFHAYAALGGIAKAAVLAMVFVSILFHELCHAAVGVKRGGGIGEVRLGTMACMPYCFTTIPGFSTMTRADRLAVLCGGTVGQMALAMMVLALTPQGSWLSLAAETAMLVALCNMLPIPGLDGHGILRELRGRAPIGAA
jgi:hypothetical protein